MNTFIGIDLGWYGKPSGLASISLEGETLRLRNIARLESADEIVDWIQSEAGCGSAVAAVDAPLVIRNVTGIRSAERELNREFRRFDAGCHAANLGRPFASNVTAFSRRLEALGFEHGTSMLPRGEGRFQVEVHPHAATVELFGLDRIVKYKRGTREERARGLRRLRSLALARLPESDLCAYIGAHWWLWGTTRNRLYGTAADGYIVVPGPMPSFPPPPAKRASPPSARAEACRRSR